VTVLSKSIPRYQAGGGKRPRGRPGVQIDDVTRAADALIAQGLKPTIERVRRELGGGSPNTVSALLDEWFAGLAQRLIGLQAPDTQPGEGTAPVSVVQAAQQFWDVARREADQAQAQKSEAERQEIKLANEALAKRESELREWDATLERTRAKIDESLASTKQAMASMEANIALRERECERRINEADGEMRRLRKALETAQASVQAVREKAELEVVTLQRDRDKALERHIGQERRLLTEIDRERGLTRQAQVELEKANKSRAAEQEATKAAQVALLELESTHRSAEADWARRHHASSLELAEQRERTNIAEQRVADLATHLHRQQEQSERQIAQMRENLSVASALLQRKQRAVATVSSTEPPGKSRSKKTPV
jgi:chromosome segregation ATPase